MSSNFLQRFKGKTNTISKDGVHDILGGGNNTTAKIFTHSNGIAMNQKANTSKTSNLSGAVKGQQSKKKIETQSRPSVQKETRKSKQINYHSQKQTELIKSNQNPFLISNPFYLDEQQRERQQKQRKQLQKQQRIEAAQLKKQKQDPKKGTYASSMNVRGGSITKKGEKQWVKMGGLGPNIGGEQWQERRKKQQKMQQFANQVKVVNTQKSKIIPPKPVGFKKQQKRDNPRNKALQYSKNVPKPVQKSYQRQQDQGQTAPIKQIPQNQMSQLQVYEMRHKQLKQMLKNQF